MKYRTIKRPPWVARKKPPACKFHYASILYPKNHCKHCLAVWYWKVWAGKKK